MKIPLLAGRDFRAGDSASWVWWGGRASLSTPAGVAIVNEAFAKQYFNGENPLGKYFEKTDGRCRFQVVGWCRTPATATCVDRFCQWRISHFSG